MSAVGPLPAADPKAIDLDVLFIPASVRARIAALEIGESIAEARRLDEDTATRAKIATVAENLRNTVTTASQRAKATTGHIYTVEVGDYRTRTYDLIVVVTVTRLA